MDDIQIKHMVERFLGWKLPENFNPDGGISFQRTFNEHSPFGPMKHEPTGTNVFDYLQATAMVRHMVEALPPEHRPAQNSERLTAAIVERLRRRASGIEEIHAAGKNTACLSGDVTDYRRAANLIEQQAARIAELEGVCSEAYQVVGALGGPVNMLDNLLAAQEGKPLPHDSCLPLVAAEKVS